MAPVWLFVLFCCVSAKTVDGNSPGIYTIVTQTFLNDASKLLDLRLADILTAIPPFGNVTQELDVGGTMRMFGNKVTRVNTPETNLNLVEPNGMGIEIKFKLIVVGGQWHLHTDNILLGEIEEFGTFVTRIQHLNAKLLISMNDTGALRLDECEVTANQMKIAFKGDSSAVSLMNLITSDQSYEDYMVESINNQTCQSIGDQIQSVLNPLINQPLMNFSNFANLSLPIALNLSLTNSTVISENRLQISQNGHFYHLHNNGNSMDILYTDADITNGLSTESLSIRMSESVPNSLFNAVRNGDFTYVINKYKLGNHGSYLNTRCSDICFGYLSSDLGTQYPNGSVELLLAIGDGSKVKFEVDTVVVHIELNITARMDQVENRQLLIAHAKMKLILSPVISNEKISTSVTVPTLQIDVRKSEIPGMTASSLQDLLEFAIDGEKDTLEEFLNQQAQKGYSLPKGQLLNWKGISLGVRQSYVAFEAKTL